VNRKLGELPSRDCTLRAMIDRHTRKLWSGHEQSPLVKAVVDDPTEARLRAEVRASSQHKAERLRGSIDRIVRRTNQ